MSKRVIKELTGMAIDEISLVDRGANQHALISFAKSHTGVDDLFRKARETNTSDSGDDDVDIDTASGSDPAGVVDDDVANDGHGDTGAPSGKTISGTQKVKGEDVKGKSGKAKSQSVPRTSSTSESTDDESVDDTTKGGALKSGLGGEFARGVKKSVDDDDEIILAKALGLIVDSWDDEVEKGFGPPQAGPFQQSQQSPQFGSPPTMQTTGAQPFGQGSPQPPPFNPGMAGGGQSTGMGAQPGLPGQPGGMQMGGLGQQGFPAMGTPQMPGTGAPAQLGTAQLPPEAIAYIQQLEQQLAQLQGQNSGSDDSSSESSDSSSSGSNSDNSNKPFGKSGDFDVDQNAFLEELSKAIRDEDRGEFSKALQARFEQYEGEISKAQEIAKSERDLRLEREFIAKAAEFSVPVAADELGPVLKRAAENLSDEDFAVIVKCLDAATELADEVFGEVGKRGTGLNGDLFQEVEIVAQEIAKTANVSTEQGIAQVFDANPAAYDEYLASRRGR